DGDSLLHSSADGPHVRLIVRAELPHWRRRLARARLGGRRQCGATAPLARPCPWAGFSRGPRRLHRDGLAGARKRDGADGSLASVALGAEAFEEDCARSAIVLSARSAPPFCRATIVDRTVWRAAGAVALTRTGNAFAMQAARPASESRPWARTRERGSGAAAPASPASARETAPQAGQFGPDD
ncbi:MAG: hypothetical protein ACJ8D7_17285, partial [Xanthobacteraceae bacterium]